MHQESGTLTARTHSGCPPTANRIRRVRVTHLPEREQTRNRRQPPIDRGRRITLTAAVADRVHIAPRPTRQRRLPTSGQEPQQHIDIHVQECQILVTEPSRERQKVIGVGPAGPRRKVPVSQISEELVHQSEFVRSGPAQLPDAVLIDSRRQSFVMRCRYPISIRHGQEPQENGVS